MDHSTGHHTSGHAAAPTQAGAAHGDPAGGHAEHPKVNYLLIFGYLCACTVIAVVLDAVPKLMGGGEGASAQSSKSVIIFLVMCVALAKALLVLNYFMHVKFEGKWIMGMLLPTTVLAMFLPAALFPDIATHYYGNMAPQLDAAADQLAEAAHASHAPGAKPHDEGGKSHDEGGKPHEHDGQPHGHQPAAEHGGKPAAEAAKPPHP